MGAPEISAQLPEKLAPLFEPARYKVLYGGRGAAKSWSIARALLLQGWTRPLRILCTREIQRTIEDSVHRLLADQVAMLGLSAFYEVKETRIVGLNGTEFLFAGLRHQDVHKIKSFEGVDICWVEEAHVVTKRSWDILIPTIRKNGSEIWVSFNPELDTDETYVRFVLHPPKDAVLIRLTWRDNPWFPNTLARERDELRARDPDAYENVWEGKCRSSVEGAIYAREIAKMLEDRRIRPVPYDPKLKVHTVWDLGWNDQTSVIFCQRLLSEVRIIDYDEESFLRFDEWARRIKDKPYVYGSHWLPPDGDAKTQAANGLSAREILRPLLGADPRIVPNIGVEPGIKAARMLFPRVYIDETRCERLVNCLKRYRRHIPTSTKEEASPLHDEYSHGADAFRYLALIADKCGNEERWPKINYPKPKWVV